MLCLRIEHTASFFRAINTAKEDIKKNKKTVDENPSR
jgi:hypothetical protein